MKNHMKCVWMSEEVLDYVSNFEGCGFSQKFENLVLFCMKEEKNRRELLAFMDDRFRERSLDLQCLDCVTRESSALIRQLLTLQYMVDSFSSLLQDSCIEEHLTARKGSPSRVSAAHSSRPLTD